MKLILILLNFCMVSSAFAKEWQLPPADYKFEQVSLCPNTDQRIYDICIDQMTLLQNGIASAKKTKKLLVVVVGATWCPYCHSLHKSLPDILRDNGKFEMVEIAVSAEGKTKVPSGIAAVNVLLSTINLDLDSTWQDYGVPFLLIVDPLNASKVVLQGSGELEDGSDNGAGHSSSQINTVLTQAFKELRP